MRINGRATAAVSPVLAVATDAVVSVGALTAKAATQACSRRFTVVVLAVAAAGAPTPIA